MSVEPRTDREFIEATRAKWAAFDTSMMLAVGAFVVGLLAPEREIVVYALLVFLASIVFYSYGLACHTSGYNREFWGMIVDFDHPPLSDDKGESA